MRRCSGQASSRFSTSVGRSTRPKSVDAATVDPSTKWRNAEPSSTPTVASPTAMSGGCGDALAHHLAEAPDPVAGQRQEERVQAEDLERGDVEDEAGPEARPPAPISGPRRSASDDERDEHEVRVAARHLDLRDEHHLEEHRQRHDAAGLETVGDRHRSRVSPPVSTMTCSSASKSTNGVTWMRV